MKSLRSSSRVTAVVEAGGGCPLEVTADATEAAAAAASSSDNKSL